MISLWKPAIALVLLMVVYVAGYRDAERQCDAANLHAEITELKRQADAAKKVADFAETDRIKREQEIEELEQKVEAYEKSIEDDGGQCALSDDDAERLRNIR